MPSDDVLAAQTDAPVRRSRGFRALFRTLKRRLGAEAKTAPGETTPAAVAASELVDQAEAFQTLRVADVMTPRADIVAVDISTPFNELLARFVEAEHSRMPVYRDALDDPVGLVHVKDVFKLLADTERQPSPDQPVIHRIKREVLFVPASMRAADLLLRMRTTRNHMAMVIDEFGGADGLVTLEDLVEAVIGDIDDEHDEAQGQTVTARPGGVFEADARAPLEDLEAALGVDSLTDEDQEEEIDTVAGLVTTLAGRVPQRGEVLSHPAGFEFEITDADPRRVKRVRVRPAQPQAADA